MRTLWKGLFQDKLECQMDSYGKTTTTHNNSSVEDDLDHSLKTKLSDFGWHISHWAIMIGWKVFVALNPSHSWRFQSSLGGRCLWYMHQKYMSVQDHHKTMANSVAWWYHDNLISLACLRYFLFHPSRKLLLDLFEFDSYCWWKRWCNYWHVSIKSTNLTWCNHQFSDADVFSDRWTREN